MANGILNTFASKLFPEGDFQSIKANAPNQMSYNIDATRDLVQNQPFNPLAPGLALGLSLPYDTLQGIGRAFKNVKSEPGILDYDNIPNDITFADIGKSIAAENPIDSLLGRTYGATLGLGDKLTSYARGLKGLFDASALAKEEPMSIEDFQVQNIEGRPVASIPENFLNYRFEDARTPFTPLKEGLFSVKNTLDNLKDKGVDVGSAIVKGIGNLVIPGAGFLLSAMKQTPEQKVMQDFYRDEFGLDNIGRIQSGIMAGYNPVYGFGGAGLENAINKRLATILKTEERKRKKGLELSQELINRRKELEALLRKEEAARRSAVDRMFEEGKGGRGQDFTGGRFDRAGSRAAYDRDPTGFSGSS